jgi:Spy/CpxP family protein refolding chaperone
MKKLLKLVLASVMILAVSTTVASADVNKGKKLYMKKLKKACGVSGAVMAGKHTQGEWTELNADGKIADEIKLICPRVKEKDLKDKYLEHYYDFFKEYGSDSGNVPSC